MIRLDGVSTSYRPKGRRGWRLRSGRVTALRDVSLEVARGEVLGVVGPNGAGKTTLLMTVAGVVRPAGGSLDVAQPVGPLISTSPGFQRELSGRENLIIGSILLGATRREAKARCSTMADFTELDDDVLDSPIFTYSAGMLVRLGFAAVAYNSPSVLLVDEVLSVADERFRAKCIGLARELVDRGAAMILVSHDMDLVTASADRGAMLEEGRLTFVGAPEGAVAAYHAALGRGSAA